MKKNLSLFLDLLRFASALGVVIGHARNELLFWVLPCFVSPTECVAVFFVLSGFVIRFVTIEKEKVWLSYARARITRIVPVAVLAVCVTVVADGIGKRHNSSVYSAFPWINLHTNLRDIVSCLTFTNEFWTRHSVVGTDEPYWSLGFEVCYYVFFGLLLYSSRRWRPLLLAAWALLVGPKILLYLPLWLLGVACYEGLSRWHRTGRSAAWLGRLSLAAGFAQLYLFRFLLMKGAPGPYQWVSLRQVRWSFVYEMAIGVGISLILVGFDLAFPRRQFWPAWSEMPLRWLAGGTFTLYLLHQPIIVLLIAFFPHAYASRLDGSLVVAAAIVSCYLLAELAERRKRSTAALFDRLFIQPRRVEDTPAAPATAL
jgi:peptidoglycan/LPS O-acetylase OafA/YrhL